MDSYLISLFYAFAVAAVLGVAFYFAGRPFLYVFTNSADVVEAGMQRMKIMCFSYAISAFMDNTIAACRGLGRTIVPTVVVIMGSCVFRVIWVYTIFAHYHTIPRSICSTPSRGRSRRRQRSSISCTASGSSGLCRRRRDACVRPGNVLYLGH